MVTIDKQLEPGTQGPLRPAQCYLEVDDTADHTMLLDADGTPTWTAGRVDPSYTQMMMNDNSVISAVTSNSMEFRPGVYLIDYEVNATNTGAESQAFRMAITNHAGTTVHKESADYAILPGDTMIGRLKYLVHFTSTTTSDNRISLRALQVTDEGSEGAVIDVRYRFMGTVRRIANAESYANT